MKKSIIWLLSLCFVFMWLAFIPSFTFAQTETNCNMFGKKCHVADINTLHTQDAWPNANLLTTIKNAINWVLWILATVVLCFCIYGWFKMLTSWSDSKWYDNWRKVLKNALIWLAIILLAWMIVSVIFWFVATLSQWNQTRSDVIQPLQN